MNILALLERSEWVGDDELYCSTCGNEYWPLHRPNCELKAAIDALRSGRLVVVEIGKQYGAEMTMDGTLIKIEKRQYIQPVYNPDLLATIKTLGKHGIKKLGAFQWRFSRD